MYLYLWISKSVRDNRDIGIEGGFFDNEVFINDDDADVDLR